MAPRRLTATSAFWRTRSPADEDKRESDDLGKFVARLLPFKTKVPLDSLEGSPAEHVTFWLRKHGQAIKPKLTAEQIKQTQQCFRRLLGIKASKKAINEMLANAGAGESGEVGYDAFVQIMTTQLLSPNLDQGSAHTPAGTAEAQGPVLSFDTKVNEYRRKKIITALHERDKDLLGMLSTTPRTEVADTPAQPPLTSPPAPARPTSASSAIVEASLREHAALMSGIVAFNARHQRASRPFHEAAKCIPNQSAVAECRSPRRAGRLLPEQSRRQRTAGKQPCQQRQQSTFMQRLIVQPNAHLTALKAQGELDSIAKPVKYSHQQFGASFAAVNTDQPQLQLATDMFGVAAVTHTQGTGMGLVMMRLASSLL
ncbi:hypothetical protein WJX77_010216 [Trebouxia sp. C0004]